MEKEQRNDCNKDRTVVGFSAHFLSVLSADGCIVHGVLLTIILRAGMEHLEIKIMQSVVCRLQIMPI